MNKSSSQKGFTLLEILVSVLIVIVLATIAVPLYDRAIEKSSLAEVSVTLKRIGESKLRIMDNRDITRYNDQFDLGQLDVQYPTSRDFTYSLFPEKFPNAVCAVRNKGSNQGTMFLFLGDTASEYCSCPTNDANYNVCAGYCSTGSTLFCQNAVGTTSCASYGMDSYRLGGCGTISEGSWMSEGSWI